MTELLIKNTLSEILFGNRICESLDDRWIVNYMYDDLMLEKLLYGEPVTVPELRKLLHNKILNFEFIKLDGEVRPAKGTTMMKYIPQAAHPKGIRPSSKKVATFYDLEKKDWRSVSQRSKEIVLKKDEETGKPVIMVKDKPEGGDVAIRPKGEEPPIEEPVEQPIEQPIEQPTEPGEVDQPELNVDGEPVDLDTKRPEAQVQKVKPIESTEQTQMYHFVNPKTGASKDIEMAPKEVIKELKRMGRGWELSEEPEFTDRENRIEKADTEKGDYLQVGDKRNYLNRKGENVEVEITGEDPDTGSFFAKTPGGAEFKIPANRMQNIGQRIKDEGRKTKVKPKGIINKGEDLENIEADLI
jgi:hypothetical protein